MAFRPSPSEVLLLAEFRERLLRAAPGQVAAIRVFGSRARGASDERSDLDVAVEPRAGMEDQGRLRQAALDAAWDAMRALRMEELALSPVVLAMGASGLAAVVAREGTLVWPEGRDAA